MFLLYMTTVQRSRRAMWMESSVKSVGSSERVSSVSVRSWYACHAAQVVFFPIPRNDDVESHLVNKWNSERDSDFSGPVLDNASKACALLHHCGCGKACRGNCKCARAGIKCTILCNCEGGCINNDGM